MGWTNRKLKAKRRGLTHPVISLLKFGHQSQRFYREIKGAIVQLRQGDITEYEVDAIVTGAGNLKAVIVIHAVGPRWTGGQENEEALLRSVYQSSLRWAQERGAKTVALPSPVVSNYGFLMELGISADLMDGPQ